MKLKRWFRRMSFLHFGFVLSFSPGDYSFKLYYGHKLYEFAYTKDEAD